MYQRYGLKILETRIFRPLPEVLVRELYAEHKDKHFFSDLFLHMADPNSVTIALMISGDEAIGFVRKINGATKPEES